MDVLDQALESSQDKDSGEEDQIELCQEGTTASFIINKSEADNANVSIGGTPLTLDSNGQYRIATDTGQGGVTYRVVQLTPDGEGGAQMLSASSLPSQTQVLGSSFTNNEAIEGLAEQKLAYIPTATGGGDSILSQQAATDMANAQISQVSNSTGQFYVMMSPQDVIQAAGQRVIVPRTNVINQRNESPRSSRDDRRRASHNEVERRRRDKINNWIVQLSKQLPDCTIDHTKTGQSKGGILSKACEYIQELRTANSTMAETLKDTERLSVDNELLRQQTEELKQENMMLRQQLQQHGIVLPDLTDSAS